MEPFRNKYRIGDVVHLRGNPDVFMTIVSYKAKNAYPVAYGAGNPFDIPTYDYRDFEYMTVWIDFDRKVVKEVFPEEALELVSRYKETSNKEKKDGETNIP